MPSPFRLLVIGAHPDDCEYTCGGTAALWSAAGHVIKFVSVTDGRSGHHQVEPEVLVSIRAQEAVEAAKVLGVESEILRFPDGSLQPGLELRDEIIRIVREFRADIVITHRPNDYHPDHRYTSQAVQDSAFMVTVPHVCPEVEALKRNPVIFYLADRFQKPCPFSADAIVPIDAVMETKIDSLACHASQVYEWLPHVDGREAAPLDPVERRSFLATWVSRPSRDLARRHAPSMVKAFGLEASARIENIEAYEACEYGGALPAEAFGCLFGHDPLTP